MKHFFFFTWIIAITFVACNNKQQAPDTGTSTTPETTTAPVADPAKDSAEIRKTVIGFYDWYNKNYTRFMEYHLYSGLKKKDAPPYTINWDEVEKYHGFIRANVPQLGEEFLKGQKRFLQQCDSAFKVDVKDDIPYGFDYDWYTNSQEDPSYLLDGIKASAKWIISVKGDAASAEIGAPEDKNYVSGSLLLYVGLKKENGQWTIAKIGND